ncbi:MULTISPECIES: FUSC family protein [Jeotgalicoccus]|uniref:Aromatic acid exporter family protein n=1 Tax=Jeotgalicoccus nanhaiensis TaxID=568603 RepID=A0ABR9Y0H6_9STAP|nr:aromatic acid exporter family protein [Jeotgalicoccus nanhaiensis]MBF0754739.1 aromatic acid exporter family protein [Jeotgalicoccus nanhaiensis]TFU60908.1 aromatic acid exporter family protein [Jeotgalicoccus nanhaiensis]
MRFGARVLKTGIAVVLTFLITNQIGLTPALIAGIAAVNALQPNVYRSLETTWNQFRGNTIGAMSAIVMVLLFGSNVLIIGLTVILVLAMLLFFKLQSVSTLAVITVVAIMDVPFGAELGTTDFLVTAGTRFSLVMLGVLVSLLVNLVFIPPRYETKMYHNCFNIANDIFKWMRLELNSVTESQNVKKDLEQLQKRVTKLETMYSWYKEERNLLKKQRFSDHRRKVLFKHLIASTRQAYNLLKRINRYENDYNHLSDDLKYHIRIEMDEMMAYHEQVFMKFTEKIKPETSELYVEGANYFDMSLMTHFLTDYSQLTDEDDKLQYENILEIITSMHEYSRAIDRVDRLANSFFSYHTDKNKIDIQDETLDI